MMKHRLLVGLTGAIVIAAGVHPSPQAAASTPCASLGGTVGPDQTCHGHTETTRYTIDFQFPVDYPDETKVTDYLTQRRDDFLDWMTKSPPLGDTRGVLHIDGRDYQSSQTKSLVLTVETEGGVHPVTTFKSFNYNVDAHTPITLDTLLGPGAQPLPLLNPILQHTLDSRGASDLSADRADTDTYQNFAITDDSVIFFINQDGAFPHDVGPLEVPVPRSQLAPLLAGSTATPPCGPGQVTVVAETPQAAAGHRGVRLTFALSPGAAACTMTGYPGVDTGAGGPLLHAQRLPRGYMGGLPAGDDDPPVVTLTPSVSAHAVVEGLAVDTSGNQCPTYSELRVTPPDSTETSTVPATIDSCALTVHPVTT